MSTEYALRFVGRPLALTPFWRLLISAASVVMVTGLLLLLQPAQPATPALLFLLAVFVSAIQFGFWPGLLASVLAFISFNYFFIVPQHTLGLASLEDSVRLLVFGGVAVLASGLAGRAHRYALTATRQNREMAELYQLSQAISAEVAPERILPLIARTTVQLLPVSSCRILIADTSGTLVEQACVEQEPATIAPVDLPLESGGQRLGVLRIVPVPDAPSLSPDAQRLLQLLAGQTVLVLERVRLAETAGQARALNAANQLKATLLSSVSHDLRTPLAVIKGAAGNLLDESVAWSAADRRELLSTIDEETSRLDRLVAELLTMSRIEAGALPLVIGRYDLGDLIQAVVARLNPTQHPLTLAIAEELPPVPMSYVQIDQVLTNLIENAILHTVPDTALTIRAGLAADGVQVDVCDAGPGLAEDLLPRVFEKFVRAAGPEQRSSGSGLGLAICKGLVEAHGGRIWATNQPAGGACFSFVLPLEHDERTEAVRSGREIQ